MDSPSLSEPGLTRANQASRFTVCSCLYSARLRARARRYLTRKIHDTNPPNHDWERLFSATPWPNPPNQPSDRGFDLPGAVLARLRA